MSYSEELIGELMNKERDIESLYPTIWKLNDKIDELVTKKQQLFIKWTEETDNKDREFDFDEREEVKEINAKIKELKTKLNSIYLNKETLENEIYSIGEELKDLTDDYE